MKACWPVLAGMGRPSYGICALILEHDGRDWFTSGSIEACMTVHLCTCAWHGTEIERTQLSYQSWAPLFAHSCSANWAFSDLQPRQACYDAQMLYSRGVWGQSRDLTTRKGVRSGHPSHSWLRLANQHQHFVLCSARAAMT